ncbi:Pyridoxal phosphate (PLP)-dependent transferases superfamily protein [Euphorbia peplus]|nr:Pyridoxal phosphate (PLP)-dependent transferases superfamily protein [Euphorbia peplus]
MLSPCLLESKKACFNGCCPAHFLNFPESETSTSITTAASSRYNFEIAMLSSISPNSRFTNPESLPSLQESFSNFITSFPQFPLTRDADRIRQQQYSHLSRSDHVCLDYTGHGLFSYSQVSASIDIPSTSTSPPLNSDSDSLFFNISAKPVCLNSQLQFGAPESDLENKFQKRIMAFMNVSENEYTMIFTSNQASAFKIVAEAYPFRSHRNVLTVYDYENEAVRSMIGSCKKRGAKASSAEFIWPGMRIQARKLQKKIERKRKNRGGLFVFPLQSRVTGARYSYSWMKIAEENGWHVLLDATSLGSKDMETLGLSLFKPDFLICSFFKVFGENPSGFACLFVKRSSLSVLNNSDSSMATNTGIVKLIPALRPSDQVSEEFSVSENRTEIEIGDDSEIEFKGLDDADNLGLILISTRTRYLINWLINALMSLEHPHLENGYPLIRIYGPKIKFERGPALAFNVFDWKGEKIDPELVQKLADRNNISLGYGLLKNFSVSDGDEDERRKILIERNKCGYCVITVALGFLTSFEDVYRLWSFISCFLDADFVEKERWRYTALNQKIIEV